MLSDRQKGLLDGVATIFPDSPHGYCLKHLEANFHKEFKNVELKTFLWKAARAKTVEDFQKALSNMRIIDPRSVDWLLDHASPEHWAELYFPGRGYGYLTSNIAESLNSWLLEAREMPILAMFERIRHQLMEWFTARRNLERNTPGLIVSKIATQLQTAVNDRARRYRYIQSTPTMYEVQSTETLCEYIVQLDNQTCSCREWQLSSIPCGHALAVILARKEDPQTYVKPFFTLQAYRNTYEHAIIHPWYVDSSQPLQFNYDTQDNGDDGDNGDEDDDDGVLPPNTRRPTGRPKKRRIDKVNPAPQRVQKCSRCREQGHSKRTCRAAI